MRRSGTPVPRLWLWRFVLALVVTSGMTAFALGGAFWYLGRKLDTATSIELRLADGPPANFLILGSDSRAFVEGDEDRASFGSAADEPGQRADVIILARVDPTTRRALLVSIPRDTLVGPAGRDARPINSLFADGPQAMVDGLRTHLSVPVHHYVELDFAGFRRIVDAIGGVSLAVPWPVRDGKTGLDLRTPGCHLLDGRMALAWVRSRAFTYQEDGRWRTDPRGDLGRIERQEQLVGQLADQAVGRVALNPLRANRLADAVLANVKVDSGLGAGDVLRLVRSMRSFGAGAVEMVPLPTVAVGPRLRPAPEAAALLARLRGVEATAPPERSRIVVAVLNGSGAAGAAARAASALAEAGFQTRPPADAERSGHSRTTIRHAISSRAAALDLATHLQGVGQLVADPTMPDDQLVVVIGADWKGVARPASTAPPQSAPPPSTTSETAPSQPASGPAPTTPPTTAKPTVTGC